MEKTRTSSDSLGTTEDGRYHGQGLVQVSFNMDARELYVLTVSSSRYERAGRPILVRISLRGLEEYLVVSRSSSTPKQSRDLSPLRCHDHHHYSELLHHSRHLEGTRSRMGSPGRPILHTRFHSDATILF